MDFANGEGDWSSLFFEEREGRDSEKEHIFFEGLSDFKTLVQDIHYMIGAENSRMIAECQVMKENLVEVRKELDELKSKIEGE